MRNVNFRYSASQPLLFENFSLTIEPGAKVGLVGRSGGGKTTITRLLLRFADIESGAILLGGQAIDMIAQADLRATIAYVPQDPAMFHRSILDNIRIGRPDATEADGSHEELRTLNGVYAALWEHQSGGFLAGSKSEGMFAR